MKLEESTKSPYHRAIKLIYPDNTFEIIPDKLEYSLQGNEEIYTIKQGDSLHSIAVEKLGDSGLWYKIADLNNIINPFSEEEFYDGLQIIIPKI